MILGLTFALAAGVGSGSGAGGGKSGGDPSSAEYAAALTTLTPETFEKTVAEGVTLVDFWSPQCSACLKQMPVLTELAPEVEGKFKIAKVNVLDHYDLAKKYGIRRLPTLMFFRDGKPVDGVQLAMTLTSYSERGKDYVVTLRRIMGANTLHKLDGARLRDDEARMIDNAAQSAAPKIEETDT